MKDIECDKTQDRLTLKKKNRRANNPSVPMSACEENREAGYLSPRIEAKFSIKLEKSLSLEARTNYCKLERCF